MVAAALLSSVNQCWETPPDFFYWLHRKFHFTLDVCATADNAKVPKFFSPEEDGLKQSWKGETCWMNPPYNPPRQACKKNCNKNICFSERGHTTNYTPGQINWVQKAAEECVQPHTTVYGLLPARTDTKLFHEYVLLAERVWFIRGRLKFVGAPANAVFPSMLVKWAHAPEMNEYITRTLPIFDTIELGSIK